MWLERCWIWTYAGRVVLDPVAGAGAGPILGVWHAISRAEMHADCSQERTMMTTSTAPDDHLRGRHTAPRRGTGEHMTRDDRTGQ